MSTAAPTETPTAPVNPERLEITPEQYATALAGIQARVVEFLMGEAAKQSAAREILTERIGALTGNAGPADQPA